MMLKSLFGIIIMVIFYSISVMRWNNFVLFLILVYENNIKILTKINL
jgi:hypothetical protein